MRKLLVLQHVAHELLGTLSLAKKGGVPVTICEFRALPRSATQLGRLPWVGCSGRAYERERYGSTASPDHGNEVDRSRYAQESSRVGDLPWRSISRENTGRRCLPKQGQRNRLV